MLLPNLINGKHSVVDVAMMYERYFNCFEAIIVGVAIDCSLLEMECTSFESFGATLLNP